MDKYACEWCGNLVDYPELFCSEDCMKAVNQLWLNRSWYNQKTAIWRILSACVILFLIYALLLYLW